MKRYIFWGGLVVILVVAAGAILYSVRDSGGEGGKNAVLTLTKDDWKQGADGAPLLIEYSDFQCPACRAYYPMVKRLVSEYGMKLQFAYRYFPLSQIHQNAQIAAYAAEAAGRQGKFWQMHDVLFERQTEWEKSDLVRDMFVQYAKDLSLDVSRFQKDLDDSSVHDRVKRDYSSGEKAGVQGTPSFFLNGQKLPNPPTYDAFKAVVDYYMKVQQTPQK